MYILLVHMTHKLTCKQIFLQMDWTFSLSIYYESFIYHVSLRIHTSLVLCSLGNKRQEAVGTFTILFFDKMAEASVPPWPVEHIPIPINQSLQQLMTAATACQSSADRKHPLRCFSETQPAETPFCLFLCPFHVVCVEPNALWPT